MTDFDTWMAKVDNLLALRYYGMTSLDLEDYGWAMCWGEEFTPEEAVQAYADDLEGSWFDGENYVAY